ncbi:hypothetical protein BH10ACT2_BH10ACT2_10430 [soil metagenome]
MSTLVLDAGALIALDRHDRFAWSALREAVVADDNIRVPSGAIAQAWRDGARQVLLARALSHCDEVALAGSFARASGILCGRASTTDVIDASVALTVAGAAHNETVAVLTSDPDDIRHLLSVLQVDARVVEI